jgi:hypothetical protein
LIDKGKEMKTQDFQNGKGKVARPAHMGKRYGRVVHRYRQLLHFYRIRNLGTLTGDDIILLAASLEGGKA